MVAKGLKTGDLELCFKKLGMVGGAKGVIMTEWKDLPMELLLRILTLTDDRSVILASGVCTGWREAICLGLTHFNLSWCINSMNSLLLSLAPKLTKLQSLSLRQIKIPQLEDNAVEAVARWCYELQDLDLSKSLKLTDQSLYALALGCPRLTKLNISGCSAFSDFSLAYLASSCINLKSLNLCGCVKAATDHALQAIAANCSQMQSLSLGWCEDVTDVGVKSLAFGCPDLRALDLCGCVLITDESIIALANNCLHLRSLGLYYCQNITDRAMYSLANSRVKGTHDLWRKSVKYRYNEEGLVNLNIGQCTALTPPAVQAVCNSFPQLHTCTGRHSLIISGCLNLTSVHCACAFQAHRTVRSFLPNVNPAH
ncbi:hypothetical protein GIB67_031923 [Kingdonia uniflora]|uniref:F-box domain-containing protein n=1 Tax=Kingdonia uniflora TaxID=39325 RepID=A0A7J7NTH1_9MAGN|nr:hypothetical protein GIB67_031923 [Kingdonia uniflora]